MMQFIVPSAAERLAAIGPTDDLPSALRRSLEPGNHFQPIPSPGPSDWLANHQEAGQTFTEFVRSKPNRLDRQRRRLYLQPFGDFSQADAPAIDRLVWFASAFFAIETAALPPVDLSRWRITSRQNPFPGQTQLLTTDLLELLRQQLRADAFALVGITMTDLYPDPKWNFVFGQALLRERVAVYSFARYAPAFYGQPSAGDAHTLVLRRSCKVLGHEICHLFGIEHCIWYRCLMNGSNHLAESDARPLHFCPVDLRKLQRSVGFDVVKRYERLAEFQARNRFSDEARWLEQRLSFLGSK